MNVRMGTALEVPANAGDSVGRQSPINHSPRFNHPCLFFRLTAPIDDGFCESPRQKGEDACGTLQTGRPALPEGAEDLQLLDNGGEPKTRRRKSLAGCQRKRLWQRVGFAPQPGGLWHTASTVVRPTRMAA